MAIIGISGKKQSGKDTVGKIIQWLTSSHTRELWLNNFEAFLEESHKYDTNDAKFEIRKFADKLKDIVCLLINCTREQLEDEVFKNTELGEEWWYYQLGNNFNGNLSELYSYLEWKDIVTPSIKYSNLPIRKLTPRLLLQLVGTECGRNIIHPNIWVNSLMSEYKAYFTSYHDKIELFPNWIITDVRFPNEADTIKQRGGIIIRVNRNSKQRFDKNEHISETSLDNAQFDYLINNDGNIEELIEKVKQILILNQL